MNKIKILITGPSGSGKSSLIHKLMSKYSQLNLSISYTSRKKRKNEVEGKDYHFVSKEEFLRLKEQDFFVETTEFADNYYGTSKDELSKENIVFDVDYEGVISIKKHDIGVKCIYISVSQDVLRRRLIDRADFEGKNGNVEAAADIELRMNELKKFDQLKERFAFDLVIDNNVDIDSAFLQLCSFVDDLMSLKK